MPIRYRSDPFLRLNLSFQGEDDRLDGHPSLGLARRCPCEREKSATAGNLHDQNGQRIDPRLVDHPEEFLQIGLLSLVELGAGDRQGLPLQKIAVEVARSIGRTVRRQQEIGPPKVGSCRVQQVKLEGPLAKFAWPGRVVR